MFYCSSCFVCCCFDESNCFGMVGMLLLFSMHMSRLEYNMSSVMTLFRFCNTFIEGFRFQCVITSCRYMRNCMISLAWKSHGHQSCKFHHCMHLYLSSWLFVLLGTFCVLVVHLNETFIVICKHCVRFYETLVRFICLFTETIIEVHGSIFRIA